MRKILVIFLSFTTASFFLVSTLYAQSAPVVSEKSDSSGKSIDSTNATLQETNTLQITGTESTVNHQGRENLQQKKEELIQRREERKLTITQRREELRKKIFERIIKHANRVIKRVKRILGRLDNILERVESRMGKFEQAGKDISSLKPLVEEAKSKKIAAGAAIEKAESMIVTVDELGNMEKPREAIHTFVTQMKEVRKALRAYHESIVNIIKSMKGMSEGTKLSPRVARPTKISHPVEEIAE